MTLTLAQMLALLPDNTTGDITAQDLRDVVTALKGPAWMNHLARRSDTPHADDDEFDDGTKAGAWSEQVVAGSATWTEDLGVLSVKATGGATGDAATILKSIGSLTAPVTIETAIRTFTWSTDYHAHRLVFTDGTADSSNYLGAGPASRTSGVDSYQVYSGTLTNTDATVRVTTTQTGRTLHSVLYVRVIWKSANTWQATWSHDAVSWTEFNMADVSFTMTPTHFGLMVTNFAGTNDLMASFEYFRVYESDLSV